MGPGDAVFETMRKALGKLPIIAEDLGHITDDVRSLREDLKLPGMKVLQFAFDSADSEHLPHNYKQNTVVYTGTHDNDTPRGWFDAAEPETRERALNYLGCEENRIPWDFVRAALTSVADIAIVPIQDVFGLDGRHRMNTPGTDQGNWEWRLPDELLSEEIGDRLRDLTEVSGRSRKKDQDS